MILVEVVLDSYKKGEIKVEKIIHVSREIMSFRELKRRILESDPDIDEVTLADTLEGATNLHEAIAATVRSALIDDAILVGLKGRMDELKIRLDRISTRRDHKRSLVVAAMEDSGIKNISEPDFTLSLRPAAPSVQVTNEAEIPEEFWSPQPPKLNKRAILDALKVGTAIMGVALSHKGITLSVRTK